MNRKDKIKFAVDYIRFLIDTQAGVDELYASVCYGGFVFDDTRIDLYEVFYNLQSDKIILVMPLNLEKTA